MEGTVVRADADTLLRRSMEQALARAGAARPR
jgi:hypothetical protein